MPAHLNAIGPRSVLAQRLARAGIVALAVAALALVQPWTGHAQSEVSYRIVVNSANPVSSLSRNELARLFLKKTIAWQSGGEVRPVDLAEDSDVRQAFSKEILGKDVSAVKGYWQQLIFTGRGVPPIEKQSEAAVLAFVAAERYAIGYVSTTASLGSDVRVVHVTP